MSTDDEDMQKLVQIIRQKPYLAPRIERVAAYCQGKGFDTLTIADEVSRTLQRLNRPPELAVDIGGNIGAYTDELLKRFPNIEIHVFEPAQTNIQKLKERFGHEKNINIVPLGVSDNAGSATLFSDTPGSGLSSLTKRRLDYRSDIAKFEIKENINTIRFEDYWATNLNKRKLDLVKLDIEGHEIAALNGFGAAIHATSVIQFELGGANIDTRTFFQDFWYFFKNHNFDIFRMTPYGSEKVVRYSEAEESFSYANYIATNQN